MDNLFSTALVIFAAILAYRFRAAILRPLQRFDARNVARHRQEFLDKRDHLAHYKHTLQLAEEQVEEVGEVPAVDERTGQAVSRYVFEGEQFLSRDEAEAARQRSIVAKARQFYVELPAALASRRKETLH
ncbi:MAG TPA: hypothetical protein VGM17_16470 [Rhizomicrobium sp.]|jgi:hypothetical protein